MKALCDELFSLQQLKNEAIEAQIGIIKSIHILVNGVLDEFNEMYGGQVCIERFDGDYTFDSFLHVTVTVNELKVDSQNVINGSLDENHELIVKTKGLIKTMIKEKFTGAKVKVKVEFAPELLFATGE